MPRGNETENHLPPPSKVLSVDGGGVPDLKVVGGSSWCSQLYQGPVGAKKKMRSHWKQGDSFGCLLELQVKWGVKRYLSIEG